MKNASDTVCVVGLGRIGLPTAATFARADRVVYGYDSDRIRREAIASGRLEPEPGLARLVEDTLDEGLELVDSVRRADVYVIAVPSGEESSDGGAFVRAANEVADAARPGQLIVVESTVAPDAVDSILSPALRRNGLEPGDDIAVAHCPERVAPGAILEELTKIPRLVGGLTPECTGRAAALYAEVFDADVVPTDAVTAALVKLLENASRDVSVAIANEAAVLATQLGCDPLRVVELAGTHPRVSMLRPGLGVGGGCLPRASRVLASLTGSGSLFGAARRINDDVVSLAHARLAGALAAREAPWTIAVLGVAYKPDVSDVEASPALRLVEALDADGCRVRLHDPHVEDTDTLEDALHGADAVVFGCAHTDFVGLNPRLVADCVAHPVVVDFVDAVDPELWISAGFSVIRR